MPKRVFTEAFASVRFYGDTMDPLGVTRALRLPPDSRGMSSDPPGVPHETRARAAALGLPIEIDHYDER